MEVFITGKIKTTATNDWRKYCTILCTVYFVNQNSIQEEIKSRLKPGKVCYNSAPNLLFSSLLSKNIKIKIRRTIILLVVLYGCENWSLILREVFENRVLRILGPKREEVSREWRKVHNEELNDLYSSLNIIQVSKARRMRWAGHVACMGEKTQHSMEWHHVTAPKNYSRTMSLAVNELQNTSRNLLPLNIQLLSFLWSFCKFTLYLQFIIIIMFMKV